MPKTYIECLKLIPFKVNRWFVIDSILYVCIADINDKMLSTLRNDFIEVDYFDSYGSIAIDMNKQIGTAEFIPIDENDIRFMSSKNERAVLYKQKQRELRNKVKEKHEEKVNEAKKVSNELKNLSSNFSLD